MNHEVDAVIERVAEAAVIRVRDGTRTIDRTLSIDGDSVVYRSQYYYHYTIHEREDDELRFPRSVLQVLVANALAAGTGRALATVTAKYRWLRSRDDTYVTTGPDYEESGEGEATAALELAILGERVRLDLRIADGASLPTRTAAKADSIDTEGPKPWA